MQKNCGKYTLQRLKDIPEGRHNKKPEEPDSCCPGFPRYFFSYCNREVLCSGRREERQGEGGSYGSGCVISKSHESVKLSKICPK